MKSCSRLGRVASLLAMVERARRVLATEPPTKQRYSHAANEEVEVTPDRTQQIDVLDLNLARSAELRMSESWKRFALVHNYDDSNVLMGSVDNVSVDEMGHSNEANHTPQEFDLSSIGCRDMFGGSDSSLGSNDSGEITYDVDWIRQQAGSKTDLIEGFSVDGAVDTCSPRDDSDDDDDDDGADNDGDEEAALNAECERLRQKLSSKMVNFQIEDSEDL